MAIEKAINLSLLETYKNELIELIDGGVIDFMTLVNLEFSLRYDNDSISENIGGVEGFNAIYNNIEKNGSNIIVITNDQPFSKLQNAFVRTQDGMKIISLRFIAPGSHDMITKMQIIYDTNSNQFFGSCVEYHQPGVVASYGYKWDEQSQGYLNEKRYLEDSGEWGIVCDTDFDPIGLPDELIGTGPKHMTLKTMRPLNVGIVGADPTVARQDLYIPNNGNNEHFYRNVENVGDDYVPVFGPWNNISDKYIYDLVQNYVPPAPVIRYPSEWVNAKDVGPKCTSTGQYQITEGSSGFPSSNIVFISDFDSAGIITQGSTTTYRPWALVADGGGYTLCLESVITSDWDDVDLKLSFYYNNSLLESRVVGTSARYRNLSDGDGNVLGDGILYNWTVGEITGELLGFMSAIPVFEEFHDYLNEGSSLMWMMNVKLKRNAGEYVDGMGLSFV